MQLKEAIGRRQESGAREKFPKSFKGAVESLGGSEIGKKELPGFIDRMDPFRASEAINVLVYLSELNSESGVRNGLCPYGIGGMEYYAVPENDRIAESAVSKLMKSEFLCRLDEPEAIRSVIMNKRFSPEIREEAVGLLNIPEGLAYVIRYTKYRGAHESYEPLREENENGRRIICAAMRKLAGYRNIRSCLGRDFFLMQENHEKVGLLVDVLTEALSEKMGNNHPVDGPPNVPMQ